MKLSDWAEVAEIIGAVAIVASLVFVGSEIRNNTGAVRTATIQSIAEQSNAMDLEFATDENLPRLISLMFDEDISREALTGEDRMRLDMAIRVALRRVENIYLHVESGVLDRNAFRRIGFAFYQTKFAGEYWSTARDGFDPKFVLFMDEKIAKKESPILTKGQQQ